MRSVRVKKSGKNKVQGNVSSDKLLKSLDQTFVEDFLHELSTNVFPNSSPIIKKNNKGKEIKDNRIFETTYNINMKKDKNDEDDDQYIPDDTPLLAKYIIEHCLQSNKLPPNAKFKIYVCQCMRWKCTSILPPTKDTVNRIIYNLRNSDVYHLKIPDIDNDNKDSENKDDENNDDNNDDDNNDDDNNKDEEFDIFNMNNNNSNVERELYMKINTSIVIGPVSQSNYKIVLLGGNYIKTPDKIKGNIKVKGMSGRTTIKPKNYSRVTVVIDIIGSEHLVQKITRETMKTIKENKSTVDEIAKQLQNNVNVGDLVNSMMPGQNKPEKKRKRRRRRKKQSDISDNNDNNNDNNNNNNIDSDDDDLNELMNIHRSTNK